MYKLVVVAGPNVGTSFRMSTEVVNVGRQSDNTIVLASDRVSKKHCSFRVEGTIVTLKDEGSSNGTFVNGGLIRSKVIKSGDRVSVGEYVLQLVEVKAAQKLQVPQGRSMAFSKGQIAQSHSNPNLDFSASIRENKPQDIKGKLAYFFEHSLMPLFYGLITKSEWRMVCLTFFVILITSNLGLSVYPLLDYNRTSLIREIKVRAHLMARQIAEQNAAFLASGAETKTEIGSIDQAEGVRVAVIVDLDNRIIAPSSKINQYLASGSEASAAFRAKNLFRSGRETGLTVDDESGMIVSIEPIKVLNPALGKNVVTAMAVVSIDSAIATPGFGEQGVIYFQTLILTGIAGFIVFVLLYKLTLRPFVKLNEDMDKALKGDLPQVTHEYQIEELNSLWEIINSAIQRISKKSDSGMSSMNLLGASESHSVDDLDAPLKMIGNLSKFGLVAFGPDKRIIHLNSIFEELSGIRRDSAIGQGMSDVARDQSLGLFTDEILGKVTTGSEGVSEDYDFSGLSYKVHVSAFGGIGQAPRCFLMILERNE